MVYEFLSDRVYEGEHLELLQFVHDPYNTREGREGMEGRGVECECPTDRVAARARERVKRVSGKEMRTL